MGPDGQRADNCFVPLVMALVLLFALVAICAAIVLKIGSREKGLPPGPPTVPILGNAHIFPTEFPHYKCVAVPKIKNYVNVGTADSRSGQDNTVACFRCVQSHANTEGLEADHKL
jgi:hypothetical protein